jgi:hypothetical protein
MKTRRSQKNQERLWKELGNVKSPSKRKRGKLPTREEARNAMFGEQR